ncbi:MAG: transporter [Verrucomicrobiales bacterium]|nr:transporter [Verrucomicrobiales bacterium]
MNYRYLKLLLGLLLIAGCAVGPNYKRPKTNTPETFRGSNETVTNSFGDLPWWEVFHDEPLQHLIRVALTNNYDLRIAVARVEQAHQIVIENRASLFPQLNYGAVIGKGKNVGSGGSVAPTSTSSAGFLGADINASWEPDIWGRVRRLTEAARAQYFATDEARHDITVALVAQVAQNYLQLLALDSDLQIARDTTNSFATSLRIFERRLQGGVGTKLETMAAQAILDANAALIPSIEQQIFVEENLLSILLGQNPGPIVRTPNWNADHPPQIPPGLPSSLLARRPDIRQAEFQLRAANAQVGVTLADRLPNLNLSALIGQVGTNLPALASGAGFAWSIGANLAGPIFQGGRLKARYREALALRDQAILQYQGIVLRALQDVSNALIAREKSAQTVVAQARAVNAYKESVRLALERYRLGKSNYYEVLQQQQQLFPTERALLQNRLNEYLATVQLYRALGGGWQTNQVQTQ